MNITVSRVKKKLCEYYNWETSYFEDRPEFYDMLIRDVLSIINDKMITYKNIPIMQRKTNLKTKKQ